MVETLACGLHVPRGQFLWHENAFCMPHITQSHKYVLLVTQPLQVTHH